MTVQNRINPDEVNRAIEAIQQEIIDRHYTSINEIEWDDAFRTVKKRTSRSNWQEIADITKEALREITSRQKRKEHRYYLKTKRWKNRRKKKLEQEDYTCERCGGNANQAHHTTYRHLDSNNPELEIRTLMAVCDECHSIIEGKITTSPQVGHHSTESQAEKIEEFERRYLEDLKQMKQEEDEKNELSNGRRRWFNQEISKTKKKLRDLEEG